MLDFSFGEIMVIAIIAVIFLGPDKLPQAFVNVAKFFKSVKKVINDAKDTLDKEIRISEIKNEVIEYKKKFDKETNDLTNDIKNDIDFGVNSISDILNQDIDYESTSNNIPNNDIPKRKETKGNIEISNKKAISNLKQKVIEESVGENKITDSKVKEL